MGPIPHLEIHLWSNTYTSQKASLYLKQTFLEILLLLPLWSPDVQGASVTPSLIKADCNQLPSAPSHFVQYRVREIVQWDQLSTFLSHPRQPL